MAKPEQTKPKGPPTPPPKKVDDLAEVERALSVLGGHHPEHERARREITEAILKKRALDEIDAAAQRTKLLKRAAVFGLSLGLLIAVGWGVVARRAHAADVDRALDPPTALFASRGFTPVATGEGKLDENVEAGCFIAVSPNEGNGKLELDHGGETLQGDRSIGFCACTPEHVVVTGSGPVRLLRADGKVVGNVDGLGAVEPRPKVISTRVEECAAEQLDAWLAEKKLTPSALDTPAFDADEGLAPLRLVGFTAAAKIPKDRLFSLVDGGAESCFLAWSRNPITLRLQGGVRPIASATGAIAWCTEKPKLVTIWRQGGDDEVTVYSVAASRVGGMLGVRERVLRSKLPGLTSAEGAPLGSHPATGASGFTAWVDTTDLAWDAVMTLQGSGVPEAIAVLSGAETESKPTGDARIVALSMAPGGSFAPDRRGDIAHFCHPRNSWQTAAPGSDSAALQTVCAQLAPQIWRQTGALGSLGIAQAPLPFWLSVFAPVKDPELTKSLVALLILARRLRGDGFEPTTLAGVVEEPSGVSVIGRAGDDAVVAVGLGPKAPYVFPYSDGEEWQLAGEPRIVELKPGERAVLSSVVPPAAAKELRRTVVFRRPVKQGK